jgi:2-C-methyl-D-erythritol 4-phosphate cytidylyltransferase
VTGQRPTWGIVLAAGAGERFGTRKQFATLGDRRLVDRSVEAAATVCDDVVLVLPVDRGWDGQPVTRVVEGGSDRAASVRAGLAAIPDVDGVVVVHQAANPLASPRLIRRLLAAIAAGAPAAFPGLRPADVVRRVAGDRARELVGRDDLVLVQTPAAFRLEVLRRAHASGLASLEDTALVSACGYEVSVVPGEAHNLHVATPDDLDLVRALVAGGWRVGSAPDRG